MTVHVFGLLGLLASLASAIVQFVMFLRWLHRRLRSDEITRAFVRDMALHHLPHIYSALDKIAEEKGTKLDEPPAIHFSDLNGHRSW